MKTGVYASFIVFGVPMALIGALSMAISLLVGSAPLSLAVPGFFILVGLAIAVVLGVLPLAKAASAAKEGKRLKKEGAMVWAEYISCDFHTVMADRGRPTIQEGVLRCRYTDPYAKRTVSPRRA